MLMRRAHSRYDRTDYLGQYLRRVLSSNMKTDKLYQFLYGESQVREEIDGLPDDLVAVFEDLEHQEALEPKKEPLANALKEIGLDVSELQVDPAGFVVTTSDEAKYSSAIDLLVQSDNIHKLAELGWVFADCGDSAPTDQEPSFRIRFLELTTAETNDSDKAESIENILKAAREFATEPLKRETNFKKPKGSGVGKASDGDTVDSSSIKEDIDKVLSEKMRMKFKFKKSPRLGKLRKSANLPNPASPNPNP